MRSFHYFRGAVGVKLRMQRLRTLAALWPELQSPEPLSESSHPVFRQLSRVPENPFMVSWIGQKARGSFRENTGPTRRSNRLDNCRQDDR